MRKMLRNIVALRQGLKAIEITEPADVEFDTARAYYSLFALGPTVRLCAVSRPMLLSSVTSVEYCANMPFFKGLLESVKQRSRFTFEEYRVMLCLQSGVDPLESDDLPPGVGGDFALNLIELQTICVE